jgi:hypothetical protein
MNSIININLFGFVENDSSFVLLVRKGNKTQCKSLDVPLDSDLVRNLKHREEVWICNIYKIY